ncbi:MAG: DNA-binding domain-containing protein [Pseudomonadota bacterium]|nr:DNA-binding domain-containing protein [Pseudomonadota bacterium]
MPALRELQHAVYRSLMEYDGEDAATHIRADGLAAADRLGIYRNTLYGTLTKALRLSYPVVHRLVGGDFFEDAAQKFIKAEPPQGAFLDEYGAGFADFLARFQAAESVPYLPDVARLEWAVSGALHAPDAAALDMAALCVIVEGNHDRVRFVPHPSFGLVRASYPVDTMWRAVLEQDEATLAAIDLGDAPIWLLIQRLATGVDVRRLSEPAWRFASALRAGQPLDEAVDLVSGVDVAALLAGHLAEGRLIAFDIIEPAAAALPSEKFA